MMIFLCKIVALRWLWLKNSFWWMYILKNNQSLSSVNKNPSFSDHHESFRCQKNMSLSRKHESFNSVTLSLVFSLFLWGKQEREIERTSPLEGQCGLSIQCRCFATFLSKFHQASIHTRKWEKKHQKRYQRPK